MYYNPLNRSRSLALSQRYLPSIQALPSSPCHGMVTSFCKHRLAHSRAPKGAYSPVDTKIDNVKDHPHLSNQPIISDPDYMSPSSHITRDRNKQKNYCLHNSFIVDRALRCTSYNKHITATTPPHGRKLFPSPYPCPLDPLATQYDYSNAS